MEDLRHPFQCIESLRSDVLVAACGSRLVVYDLRARKTLSEWSPGDDAPNAMSTEDQDGEDAGPPAKKPRTLHPTKPPSVIKLTVAEDNKHVVAVTDDKVIRVFRYANGELEELSQRVMPKRPCAIQILPDSTTILCADKFGDVYSLPLLHTAQVLDTVTSEAQPASTQQESRFKPSATTLTVHSQRNRQALEAQKNQKNFTPRKEVLTFEHHLLLGHVSMLTDMKYTESLSGGKRGYILTTDRDEHIRISRAAPQAHIIEGFCLGHTSFVSKICQLETTSLIVSGGGDTWLGVWGFPDFKLLHKVDLLKHVRELSGHENDEQLAVSGIWSMNIAAMSGQSREPMIVVACEKVRALFLIPRLVLDSKSTSDRISVADDQGDDSMPVITEVERSPQVIILRSAGCPLDVAIVNENLVVSLDVRQRGMAVRRLEIMWSRAEGFKEDPRVHNIEAGSGESDIGNEVLSNLNNYAGPPDDATGKELDDLLYTIGNLRKRGRLEGENGNEEVHDD